MVNSRCTTPVKAEPDQDSLPPAPAMSPTGVAQSHIQSYCAQHNETPSFNAIIAAYHREGKGDRELLLALLKAKHAEDERLAARDRLKAEQLAVHAMFHARYLAYFSHAAAYPNTYYCSPPSTAAHATSPTSPSTDSNSRSRESSFSSASSSTATSPPADRASVTKRLSKKRSAMEDVEEVTREDALRALRHKLARQSPPTTMATTTTASNPSDSCRKRRPSTAPKSPKADKKTRPDSTTTGNSGMDVLLTAVDQERRAMEGSV